MRGRVHRWRLLRMEEKANVEGIQGGRRGYGGGYLELKEGVKEDGKRRKEHRWGTRVKDLT